MNWMPMNNPNLHGTLLSLLLTWGLSGCALLQAPEPVTTPVIVDCQKQDAEIARLQQQLAEKEAQIQVQRVQQKVQASELRQTSGEVARAEIKLRRLATQADAASQLAEVEVALQGLRSGKLPGQALAQLDQVQRILDSGAASFAQHDYGAAVEAAAQAQEIIDRVASGRYQSTSVADTAVEMPLQAAIALRTRSDCNLRAQPGRTHAILGVLRKGAVLQAQAYRGAWLRVQTEDGRNGWVLGQLLEVLPAAAE